MSTVLFFHLFSMFLYVYSLVVPLFHCSTCSAWFYSHYFLAFIDFHLYCGTACSWFPPVLLVIVCSVVMLLCCYAVMLLCCSLCSACSQLPQLPPVTGSVLMLIMTSWYVSLDSNRNWDIFTRLALFSNALISSRLLCLIIIQFYKSPIVSIFSTYFNLYFFTKL